MKWSPQQAEVLDGVARWFKDAGNPICRVFGFAGTGKTTLAKHFASGVNGDVAYGAFTGKAAMVMRKNGCKGAQTIHSLIYDFEENDKTGEFSGKLKPAIAMGAIKLFIIDECSMVDEELARDLLSFRKPILVLGDPAQLPPVKGGGFFTDAEPDFMLTEIHRQAEENPIVRLATEVREGRRLQIGQYGESKVIARRDVETDEVVAADQVLVGVNATRDRYNGRLRQLAGREGEFPVKGDRLVALKNDRAAGVFNGSIWTVLQRKGRTAGALNDHCLTFSIKSDDFEEARPIDVKVREEFFNGNPKGIPWRELRGTQQFDYGYALTVHKSQGSQWGSVFLFDESPAFGDNRGRHLYTGLTRAAEKVTVVL